jgi:uncharacterized Zn-binding protein involved in type VI secretion
MGQRPFIVLGDATDHGGIVIGASQVSLTHGKPIARVGDQVTCPRRGHGTTVIVTGDPTMIIDGSPAARHGDRCACGAILISGQFVSTVGDGGGGGNGAAHTQANDAVGAYAHSQASTHEDEEILEQFFEAVDADGQPVEGYKFDLFANDALHTKAAHLMYGQSAVVDGDATLRLVMWVAGDGGARHG